MQRKWKAGRRSAERYDSRFCLDTVSCFKKEEDVVRHFGSLSEPSNEIALGCKWQVINGGVVGFALLENIINNDNSPDFGIHLSYSYDF
jgi:hypothetical protein